MSQTGTIMKTMTFNELSREISDKFDIFICSSSFEERCLSICSTISYSKLAKSFIVFNKEYEVFSKNNLNRQKKIISSEYSLVETSCKNPLFSADSMRESIVEYIIEKRRKSILLDITTFTHETLLILLKLLITFCPSTKITCVYTSAKEYCAGEDISKKWLSSGIEEVRAVLGYSGNFMPSKKTHLFVIVGYEYERAIAMINILEPNFLSLGYGKSENATVEKDKEANSHYYHLVMEMSPSYPNVNKFEISCNDPYKTYDILGKYIKEYRDENIFIAPMNNKISTIGAGLFALKNETVQLCYGPALTYNIKNYSKPGSKCYLFDVDLTKI
jgi:hypothetical protein